MEEGLRLVFQAGLSLLWCPWFTLITAITLTSCLTFDSFWLVEWGLVGGPHLSLWVQQDSEQETDVYWPHLTHPCLDYRLVNVRGFHYSQHTPDGMCASSVSLCLYLPAALFCYYVFVFIRWATGVTEPECTGATCLNVTYGI